MHACMYVCYVYICVLVSMHLRKAKEDIWYPALPLCLIPLRQGPSMNLELGWWPESPSESPSLPHTGLGL